MTTFQFLISHGRPLHHSRSACSECLMTPSCVTVGLMAPLYFKKAVDALATQTHVAAQAAVMALLWSGGCRIVNGLAKELQHPIFTPVAQAWLSSCHSCYCHMASNGWHNCIAGLILASSGPIGAASASQHLSPILVSHCTPQYKAHCCCGCHGLR